MKIDDRLMDCLYCDLRTHIGR